MTDNEIKSESTQKLEPNLSGNYEEVQDNCSSLEEGQINKELRIFGETAGNLAESKIKTYESVNTYKATGIEVKSAYVQTSGEDRMSEKK
jgi:hypothetical protein